MSEEQEEVSPEQEQLNQELWEKCHDYMEHRQECNEDPADEDYDKDWDKEQHQIRNEQRQAFSDEIDTLVEDGANLNSINQQGEWSSPDHGLDVLQYFCYHCCNKEDIKDVKMILQRPDLSSESLNQAFRWICSTFNEYRIDEQLPILLAFHGADVEQTVENDEEDEKETSEIKCLDGIPNRALKKAIRKAAQSFKDEHRTGPQMNIQVHTGDTGSYSLAYDPNNDEPDCGFVKAPVKEYRLLDIFKARN